MIAHHRATRQRALALAFVVCGFIAGSASADWYFYPGDYSEDALIGSSLPPTWRPFANDSPWNTKIDPSPTLHPDNTAIMGTIVAEKSNIRFANSFLPPVWVVNMDNMPMLYAESGIIFDAWDQNLDDISDVPIPLDATMYPEPTNDGHIIIVDPFHLLSFEMSKYTGISNNFAQCTTFNIWDLTGSGVGNTKEGERYWARGGRGSGFPVIAGLLRPEEVLSGVVDHALVFSFLDLRDIFFIPPAARTDGVLFGNQYPMAGMRFQLDPALTDTDFNNWGLGTHAKVVARALQEYGMFVGDRGGDMALSVQLLDSDPAVHRVMWDTQVPDLYDDVKKIPTNAFRAIDTGPSSKGGGSSVAVQPLIHPVAGDVPGAMAMTSANPGAQIRYTTDGSEPHSASTLYTGPFWTLPDGRTFKARAFNTNMAESPVTRAHAVKSIVQELPSLSPSGLFALFAATVLAAVSALRVRTRNSR
jgi:hypothetical protein